MIERGATGNIERVARTILAMIEEHGLTPGYNRFSVEEIASAARLNRLHVGRMIASKRILPAIQRYITGATISRDVVDKRVYVLCKAKEKEES